MHEKLFIGLIVLCFTESTNQATFCIGDAQLIKLRLSPHLLGDAEGWKELHFTYS